MRWVKHENPCKLSMVALLTCWALSTSPAVAEKKGAREFFKEGVSLFKNGKYTAAAKAFENAYELKPTYKILFNIGQAYAADKKYALAIQAFEQYMVDGGDDLSDERRNEVLDEIGKLRPLVGYIGVESSDGIAVFVDGVERGITPLASKIMLTVGHPHTIELRRGDKVLLSRSLSVYGGLDETINYKETVEPAEPIKPVEVPEPQPPPLKEPEEEDQPTNKLKLWGWVSVGIGAAILTGGGVLGGLTLGQNNKLNEACPSSGCSPNRSGEVDALKMMGLAADIAFGVGGALAATGVVLLIINATKKEQPDETDGASTISIIPTPLGISTEYRF